MSQDYNIRVVCRLRPLNKIEMAHGGECCVRFSDGSIQIAVGGDDNKYEFGFDRVFAPDTRQVLIYEDVARPILNAVVSGFNGTVFAYGQTGGGKTWTMEGPSHDDEELKGLIPRMMEGLFEKISTFDESQQFTVKCSYIEIYNERIVDLLDPSKNKLQVKEDKQRGIFIQDCTEIYVASVTEMRNTMKSGSLNRRVAFTGMNERSSRSHSIFIVQVGQKDTKKGSSKNAKLYFVDLAGSEKVGKTGVSGQQLQEAKNINKSLSCLGNVINALTSQKKEHVPYRDSKLTRILQESLGGNSRTTLIINCSMCSYNDKETLSTLRFGYRAKSIKNKPLVNEEKSAKELQILLDHAKKTIQQLTDQLKASGKLVTPQAGTVLTNDERERYEAKIQELKDELMNRSDPVNTSIGTNSEMELRIKQLLLENNSLSHKLNTDVERLEQENRKHIETIESLFTKEATLQKLLGRLATDLNFLKLNLKYTENTEEAQSQNKSLQSIDCILKDISQFAEFLTITNDRLAKEEELKKQQDSSSMELKKLKYETSLSEPNLHQDTRVVRNFEEISCIIKEKLNEDSLSDQGNKEQEQNSTEIETLINEFSKESDEKNRLALIELTRENGSLQKLLDEMKQRYDEEQTELKLKEQKAQEFYDDVLKRANCKIEELTAALKSQSEEMKRLQESVTVATKDCNDQKTLSQKLLKIIEGNHDMNQRHKIEQKARQYASERQKLFNQVYQLREQLDDAEISLKEKDELIESLKNIMKTSLDSRTQQPVVYRPPPSPEVIRRQYNEVVLGVQSKNIVKTIKGGSKPAPPISLVEQIKKSSLRSKLAPPPKKTGLVESFKNLFS